MFEESKAWLFIFIIGVLIAGGYGAHYLSSVDSANAVLIESKSKLAGVQEMMGQRKKMWDTTSELLAQAREVAEHGSVLAKAKELLDKRYRIVDSDLKYAVDSMRSSVERIRESAPGAEVGDVNLVNGKVLLAAKIRKVEESNISFIHSSGIGTVTVDLLPNEILEKYDLGSNALLPQIEAAQARFLGTAESTNVAVAPAAAATSAAKTSSPTSTPAGPNVDQQKAIKLKIATLESRIETQTTSVARIRETASQHQMLATQAKTQGKPSTRYTADANSTLVQAQQMDTHLAAMREELKKLRVELEFAENSR